jgi:hypothetical protein
MSTTQHNEKPRKHPKTPEQKVGTLTSGFMTSLMVALTGLVTFGYVTSGSHVGHFEKVRENDTRKTSNVVYQTLRFEKVRENDARKTSNVAFQTLQFVKEVVIFRQRRKRD